MIRRWRISNPNAALEQTDTRVPLRERLAVARIRDGKSIEYSLVDAATRLQSALVSRRPQRGASCQGWTLETFVGI